MWAIIETGGKQYRVEPEEKIEVERIEAEKDSTIKLDKVLFVSKDEEGKDVIIGQPYIEKAEVEALVLGEIKGDKVTIFKYKPKKRYRVKKGHRQIFTQLQIKKISC